MTQTIKLNHINKITGKLFITPTAIFLFFNLFIHNITQAEPDKQPILLGVFNEANHIWFPPAGANIEILGENFSNATCYPEAPQNTAFELCNASVKVVLANDKHFQVPLKMVSPKKITATLPKKDEFKILGFPELRFYHTTNIAKIIITRDKKYKSVMQGPELYDRIDVLFLNHEFNYPPSSAGLYTTDGSGSGLGIFQRYPTNEIITKDTGKAAIPGDILTTYGTGYRERRFLKGTPIINGYFGVYELKIIAPNGKIARLYAGSTEPLPGGMLYVGDTNTNGLDQYNLELPNITWFKKTFGEDLNGVVPFEIVIIPGSSLVYPSYPSNSVTLPIEFEETTTSLIKKSRTSSKSKSSRKKHLLKTLKKRLFRKVQRNRL